MGVNKEIDIVEVTKFKRLANEWWDIDGPFKTLHDINFCRMDFIKKHCQLSNMHI